MNDDGLNEDHMFPNAESNINVISSRMITLLVYT